MTVSGVTKNDNRSYIERMMKKFVRNHSCLELLRFFAAHPDGRFSKLAIVHAIDDECSRLEMDHALEEMVAEKILDVTREKSSNYYTLTKEEVLRRLVLNMALFELRDWQLVLGHN